MDQLKSTMGSFTGEGQQQQGGEWQQGSGEQKQGGGGGLLGGITNKLSSATGGGKEGEAKEDGLDKGVDFAQEKVLGQSPQDHESAVEQAKDEQISDFIRGQYKSTSGKDHSTQDKS